MRQMLKFTELNNLPKVMQQVDERAKIWTQADWLQSTHFLTIIPMMTSHCLGEYEKLPKEGEP